MKNEILCDPDGRHVLFFLHILGHTGCISGIKFDVKHPSVIWSTSIDGTLRSVKVSIFE